MAERQAPDKAIRTSIISVIVALIIFGVIVGAWKINDTRTAYAEDVVPEEFATGEPIIVSDLGVGTPNPTLPEVDWYFSYSCPACADLDHDIGSAVASEATGGNYNLALHPVNTGHAPYLGPATSAALVVAAEDPEHFVAFNQSLSDFFWQQAQVGNNDVVGNLDASAQQVALLARQAGVDPAVIGHFGKGARAYLEASTKEWSTREVKDRQRTATPEVVLDGTALRWQSPDELLSQLPGQ